MKRIFALTLALTMVLSLAACGGKSTDQPSGNNTPPVTQGETTNQPDSAPADNTQPSESEPADTTTDEPQNNAGALPEGGFYLYDGVHYLSEMLLDGDINFTVISGEKAANTVHEISVEQGENPSGRVCGSMSFVLGQNEEPFDYQISFADESMAEYNGIGKTVTPMGTECFSLGESFSWVVNLSDEEKTVADCPILCFTIDGGLSEDSGRKVLLDGQPIAKLNDLINILGTPTAAYNTGGIVVTYIWQFENFIYTAQMYNLGFEGKFDEAKQTSYYDVDWESAEVTSLSYYALNYNLDEINLKQGLELWATTWPVQALTDLGLL